MASTPGSGEQGGDQGGWNVPPGQWGAGAGGQDPGQGSQGPPPPPGYGQGPPPGYGQGPPPGYGQGPPPGYGAPPVNNNLVWAILSTLFCCLPLGIVSIVFAAQVSGKQASGDYAGAQDSARKARQWAIYSAAAGVVAIVLYIIFIVVLGIGGGFASSDF